jgi:glucokinase
MQVSAENGLVVGVDIGGTKVAAGLVDSHGTIGKRTRVPMVSTGGPREGLAAVSAAINALFSDSPDARYAVRAIGICAPGPLDPRTGIVINPPNLPCWRDFPLAAEVAQIYEVPVRVDNDANAAAIAEAQWGAGRGYKDIFYATIGTGIGSGIILDGHIYHGRTGAAGEGGHVSIDYHGPRCRCGKPGCIEILASGPAIARRARAKLEGSPASSTMLEYAAGKLESITTEIVGRAYSAGDPLAREVVLETAELLSVWLSNMVDLLDPEAIIVGGGVAVMLSPTFEHIRKRMVELCVNSRSDEVKLLMARYGADSGIAGGAALCLEVSAASQTPFESVGG